MPSGVVFIDAKPLFAAPVMLPAARWSRSMMYSVCRPTFAARTLRSSACRGLFLSASKTAFEFQAHAPLVQPGIGTPRASRCLTRPGKLSSNGPRRPAGYQMKWPMPSDAKSSPPFQLVRPATLPAHSFCQMRWPTRFICAEVKPACAVGRGAAQPSRKVAPAKVRSQNSRV